MWPHPHRSAALTGSSPEAGRRPASSKKTLPRSHGEFSLAGVSEQISHSPCTPRGHSSQGFADRVFEDAFGSRMVETCIFRKCPQLSQVFPASKTMDLWNFLFIPPTGAATAVRPSAF